MVNCLEHEVCCYNRKFRVYIIMIFNLENVVGVWAGRRRNCGSIPDRGYNFFFQIVDIGSGAHAVGTGGSSPPHQVDTDLHTVQGLRMRRAVPLVPHITLSCAQGFSVQLLFLGNPAWEDTRALQKVSALIFFNSVKNFINKLRHFSI